MLEHRYKKRYQASLDVVVLGRKGLRLHGKVCDISTDGVFIQLVVQAVPINTVVDLEFSCGGCLRGWVAHAGNEGVGVMFRSVGEREKMLLKRLLSKAPTTNYSTSYCMDDLSEENGKKEANYNE